MSPSYPTEQVDGGVVAPCSGVFASCWGWGAARIEWGSEWIEWIEQVGCPGSAALPGINNICAGKWNKEFRMVC
jgi:hypothetical protein